MKRVVRHSRWQGPTSSALVSRSRAMPVGDRRSIGAGFALPRDAGRRPALQLQAVPALLFDGRYAVSGAGFALPRDAGRRPALQFQAVPALLLDGRYAVRRVIGAGFALPRDAGRRPALQAVPALFCRRALWDAAARGSSSARGASALVSRSYARCRSETGAPSRPRPSLLGRALRSSARHRRWFRAPARCRSETGAPSGASPPSGCSTGVKDGRMQSSALVSRSHAMPVGDRRSKSRPRPLVRRALCSHRRWFRAPARCRSETGAPRPAGCAGCGCGEA